MATSVPAGFPRNRAGVVGLAVPAAYALGAVGLGGEAVVHVQQYFALLHDVRWIGPLFLLNAVACVLVIVALASARTRPLAALAGIAISAVALGALVVSYGRGLFGWQEAGFRTPVELAVIAEVVAVVGLAAAVTATVMRPHDA
jgi:hypothetical protein